MLERAAEIWNFKEKNKNSASFQQNRWLLRNIQLNIFNLLRLANPVIFTSGHPFTSFQVPTASYCPSFVVLAFLLHWTFLIASILDFQAQLGSSDPLLCPWKRSLTPPRSSSLFFLFPQRKCETFLFLKNSVKGGGRERAFVSAEN